MSQFLSNAKETQDRHFGELENSTADAEKVNASSEDEGSMTKHEQSISESDSEVFRMRSRRTYFTTQQREALEQTFSTSQYINPKLREALASSIGVSDRVVQTWFKNRRVKWRKERRTQFKVFVEPPQPIDQPLVLMPHIAYAPINYYNHVPYYGQRHPTTTSPSTMTATSTYIQNSSGENHFQNGEFFAWNKDAFN